MGGRGASFGGGKHKYGTEYRTVMQVGNIKFVKQNASGSVTAPLETQSKGRIYVTLNSMGKPSHITFYVKGKRVRQIDLRPPAHNGLLPHTHRGYLHNEKGTRDLYAREKKIVAKVREAW